MKRPPAVLFENARVFTADPFQPGAEALAVRGERILSVGSLEETRRLAGPDARRIDCGGATLMPGFIDCHFHLMYGALNLDGMQFGEVISYEQLAAVLREYAASHPDDPWLHGSGLRYNTGPGGAPLTREHLDALVADRPIYINAFDGHTSWANTRALELAGILRGGDTGPNSEIVLRSDGLASGELREPGAYAPVSRLVPKPDAARTQVLLREALRLAAAAGVTSVHNMDGDYEQTARYAGMEQRGELSLRVYMPFSMSADKAEALLAGEALQMKHDFTGPLVRAGAVKFFIDGVIEGYTGLLVEPYADDPATCGSANYEREHYERLVMEADRLGLQIFTHSVGDGGVRLILDAYARAARAGGRSDARHRIEHIELVHPDDIERFGRLGVIASMQPLHAPFAIDDGDIWPARVGAARWPYSFAWQALREAGARLVFGSDWPVVSQDPMRGVFNALNRQSWAKGIPNHRQTLTDTLIAYTRDAAYAEFQEEHKGRLKAGWLADLVLLSEDLFTVPPAELRRVKPRLTMLGGRVVYEA